MAFLGTVQVFCPFCLFVCCVASSVSGVPVCLGGGLLVLIGWLVVCACTLVVPRSVLWGTLGVPWPYSGSTLGLLWEYLGTTVPVFWEYCPSTLGVLPQYSGSTAPVPWDYPGSTVPVLWEYCTSTLGVLHQYPGTTLGVLCQYSGSTVQVLAQSSVRTPHTPAVSTCTQLLTTTQQGTPTQNMCALLSTVEQHF